MEPQVLQWGPKVPQSAKKTQKGHTKCHSGPKLCCKVAKQKTSTHRHKQPTNQRNKEGHKETNNQTNTHTHKQTSKQTNKLTNKLTNKHTNKHPNNKTTSFALQTQTQTPAARCSPKAT